MPGPYSSLMVLRRRRSGRGGLRVPEKTDLRGLWEIYCRLKRHCAVILSYMANIYRAVLKFHRYDWRYIEICSSGALWRERVKKTF